MGESADVNLAKELTSTHPAEPSAAIRERILAARAIQQARFAATPKVRCNARMSSKQIKAHCQIGEDSLELLRSAMHELNLGALLRRAQDLRRAHDRILKVARPPSPIWKRHPISTPST